MPQPYKLETHNIGLHTLTRTYPCRCLVFLSSYVADWDLLSRSLRSQLNLRGINYFLAHAPKP